MSMSHVNSFTFLAKVKFFGVMKFLSDSNDLLLVANLDLKSFILSLCIQSGFAMHYCYFSIKKMFKLY